MEGLCVQKVRIPVNETKSRIVALYGENNYELFPLFLFIYPSKNFHLNLRSFFPAIAERLYESVKEID